MNFRCKLLFGAVFVAYWRCQSKRNKMDKARLRCATILHRISPFTKGSIQNGTCSIILRLAVAITRSATRLKSSTLTATSTRNAAKTESTFPFQIKRWSGIGNRDNPDGRNHLYAPRPASSIHPIPCPASPWRAPHEIRIGEWQDALPAIFLCAVL